jgi:hypothetical protein
MLYSVSVEAMNEIYYIEIKPTDVLQIALSCFYPHASRLTYVGKMK